MFLSITDIIEQAPKYTHISARRNGDAKWFQDLGKGVYMAWGYEKAFIVEHVEFKKKLSCKDCCYYEKDDKSCLKRPLYLPEDGYNSWKSCKYFEPTKDAMKNKKDQVEKYLNKTNTVKGTSSKYNKVPQNDGSKAVNISIHTGDIVEHKAYGKGKVIKIKDNHIFVSFNGLEKMFYFPDAFVKGFLKK